MRAEALSLLPAFLAAGSELAGAVTKAVAELIDDFPVSSWENKAGSLKAAAHRKQLVALMDALVAAADAGIDVVPLLEVGTCCFRCNAGGSTEIAIRRLQSGLHVDTTYSHVAILVGRLKGPLHHNAECGTSGFGVPIPALCPSAHYGRFSFCKLNKL